MLYHFEYGTAEPVAEAAALPNIDAEDAAVRGLGDGSGTPAKSAKSSSCNLVNNVREGGGSQYEIIPESPAGTGDGRGLEPPRRLLRNAAMLMSLRESNPCRCNCLELREEDKD